jgi:hypothetical protein
MKGLKAVIELSRLGYRFKIAGDLVRYEYTGADAPDPGQVKPLLEVLKAQKEHVRDYLARTKAPIPPEHILTCADCDFHEYQGPNPAHGWGLCTFNAKWCYGLRSACPECKEIDG